MDIEKNKKLMTPFVGTIASIAFCIIASFIKYMGYSGLFYSRKFSLSDMFFESIKNPDIMLATDEDIFVFVIVVLGIVFIILSLIFILLKKPRTYVMVIIAFILVLFGTNGKAWLHFVALSFALVFAIWFRIVYKRAKKSK